MKRFALCLSICSSVMYVAACGPGSCFAPGTAIATPDGDVPIESLRVGDMVWSYDHAADRRVAAPVTHVFRHANREVRTLSLSDGRTLDVTSEHPFYVAERNRYVPARDLRVGDELTLMSSTARVRAWSAPRRIPQVHNIAVAAHHNYFAAGVLVHNKSPAERDNDGDGFFEGVDCDDNDPSITTECRDASMDGALDAGP